MIDVVVIGGGPAGMTAALRAGDLGAKTILVTRDKFGGMAANDGPVPVRTLAHAARLPLRDTRNLERYGIVVESRCSTTSRLLARVREVVEMYARTRLSARTQGPWSSCQRRLWRCSFHRRAYA